MKVKVDAQEFKRLIENTRRFVGVNRSEELMHWIYLQIDAKNREIKATALDGHRISVEYAKIETVDESFSCYIKSNIPKVFKSDQYAELEVKHNRLYCQVGESIMGYVQPEGTFFDVDKLIKDNCNNDDSIKIAVNAKYLKDAMESIGHNDFGDKIAIIHVENPKSPIVIKSGKRGKGENLKIVLPCTIRE